jgi:hypothetical protein
MPTDNFVLVFVSSIFLALLGAIVATWAIRRFTNLELAWKAAVVIGIIFSVITWFR